MSGLKLVAVFEAAKGGVVVLLGIGVANVHHIAHHLGLENSSYYKSVFIEIFKNLNDRELWELAILAAVYSVIRFTEAYGLWKERSWAEWLAIFSGGIYLPFEIIKIAEGYAWWKVVITAFNIIIVGYLISVKLRKNTIKAVTHKSALHF
ncbi:DUF2127 domain-containing protein [Bdellovibrio sp. KM01]|uniref:DUF2127 domain-containing protein n=1 Tax=Bdellovibrio sp. KM01 TaxID=2748865 RepID=UPI0015EB044D|nr:DUF2127 domain-containing protein [Bdellovibrio sp. KM01]QLY24345.1 DUF2127 domain-containing protein [Bdellovibrio sp. KM01]